MSKLLIAGTWVDGASVDTLRDKYSGGVFGTMAVASSAQIGEAVTAAVAAVTESSLTPYDRYEILMAASRLVAERRDLFCGLMRDEAGFTRADGENEVQRCIQTLQLSAEEAKRLNGDLVPMHAGKGVKDRIGFTIHAPRGVICAITPFNSPLNTVAHKIAPAFAAGNAAVLKPSSSTPLTACLLAQTLVEAGMPSGFLSVLHGSSEVAAWLLEDQRVRFFAFTGSTEVGRKIQLAAGLRRTQMELGSIACTIVCDDADLDKALPKIVNAGYRKAGQVCTSIQLLLVQQKILRQVESRLAALVSALPYGDPRDEKTVVGPLISEKEAMRVENWVAEAVAKGAKQLAGGARKRAVVPPVLLGSIDESMKVGCQEIFGPVVCVVPFDTLDQAIARVNATPYGLATGLFTNRLDDAFAAARKLEVGGVHVNETSSSRVDLMPYGGSKDSGFGREGPRYAVHDMTEERIVTFSLS